MLEFVDLCIVKLEGTLGVGVKYVWFMSYEGELYVSQITNGTVKLANKYG
jgi:hypothetical protein